LRIAQEWHHVIDAERDFLNVIHLHDVKAQFSHFQFQLVPIVPDDTLQGRCKSQFGRKPHTALLMSREGAVLQEVEKGRDFGFQFLQEVGIIAIKSVYLPYPISGFSHVNDDWE